MLRRLLMVLLTLCLAAPAVAAPHCVATPVTAHADHHGTAPAPTEKATATPHLCIGCIAPLHGVPTPEAVALLSVPPGSVPQASDAPRAPPKPATPPPRA